ncbi:MAG: aminotransferase class I/II-fold pyridoxal phosphate-dependent enzyme [Methylococcales bacterium]
MDHLLADRMAKISPFYVMDLLRRAKVLEQQGCDIIHMEVGEPDFKSPQAVINAGIEAIQSGKVGYTEAAGLLALREKIAAFYAQQYGVKVDAARIFITPGASGALLLAFGATLNAGDKLLMADPGYPCNRNFMQLFGAQAEEIAVNAASHYHLNADLIKQHWQECCKGVLVASPSNPTGTVIRPEVLKQAIAQVAQLRGCFFSDEIYHGLVYGQSATTALQFSDEVFVINSFSKFFGMTGWRIGWLIVPDVFVGTVEKLAQNIFIATSMPAQHAALAAFEADNLKELTERTVILAKRRDFLYDQLIQLGFEVPIKPEGAFYIYANCAKHAKDSFQFAYDLLEAEGVAVTPGKDFGENAARQHIRFAYTTSLERIELAMQRLKRFIG